LAHGNFTRHLQGTRHVKTYIRAKKIRKTLGKRRARHAEKLTVRRMEELADTRRDIALGRAATRTQGWS
jgi:hypothetical protein